MSRDYKLNKSELTRLKRQQRLFLQYLPVLTLKQEQLQLEQNRIKKAIETLQGKHAENFNLLRPYVKFFSESSGIRISDVVVVDEIKTYQKTVAGVAVKILESIKFKPIHVPYFQSSPWLLRSFPILHQYLHGEANLSLLREEDAVIKAELRKATKKVNLFDKVLIPKTITAIKRIKITLQDEQVASVSRSKKAKLKKLNKAEFLQVA